MGENDADREEPSVNERAMRLLAAGVPLTLLIDLAWRLPSADELLAEGKGALGDGPSQDAS